MMIDNSTLIILLVVVIAAIFGIYWVVT